MTGTIVLAGGAEFSGRMADIDRAALERAGGVSATVRIIPTAAAPDNNHERAGRNGVRWFRSLAARDVASVPLIDTASANDPTIAATLRAARMIYLLGGFPAYLGQTLSDSQCWLAAQEAYGAGAVLAGSSAGAMVLCSWYYDSENRRVTNGLGLVPNSCVLPHHNTFGKGWAANLTTLLPESTLIGIDEQTGMLSSETDAGLSWQCYGRGVVTVYRRGVAETYPPGTHFQL